MKLRLTKTLAVLLVFIAPVAVSPAFGDERQGLNLNELIATDKGVGHKSISVAIGEACHSEITAGNQHTVFRGYPTDRIIVHYSREFSPRPNELWTILSENPELKYVILELSPNKHREALKELKALSNVELVEPYCTYLQTDDQQLHSQNACKPTQTITKPTPLNQHGRAAPACPALDPSKFDDRREIGFFELNSTTQDFSPPLVVVIDEGFRSPDPALESTLGTALFSNTQVQGWNYCTQSTKLNGTGHGNRMVGLIAGPCSLRTGAGELTTYIPGIAPAARIFPSQVFSASGSLASYEAVARAIQDANHIGAKIINASFVIKKSNPIGLESIRKALYAARKNLVLVTSPDNLDVRAANTQYPAAFDLPNVFAVQQAVWSRSKKTMSSLQRNWYSRLDLGSPHNPKLADSSQYPGSSNSAALVSGALARLLSIPKCKALPVKGMIAILKANGHAYRAPEDRNSNRSEAYLDLSFMADKASIAAQCELHK